MVEWKVGTVINTGKVVENLGDDKYKISKTGATEGTFETLSGNDLTYIEPILGSINLPYLITIGVLFLFFIIALIM